MQKFEKQPYDVRDFDVEMLDWFDSVAPGDDIQSVTASVTETGVDPDLVLGPQPQPETQLIGSQPTAFKVWVGGGVDGVTYQVTCQVLTEGGRKKEVDFKIKVKEQ